MAALAAVPLFRAKITACLSLRISQIIARASFCCLARCIIIIMRTNRISYVLHQSVTEPDLWIAAAAVSGLGCWGLSYIWINITLNHSCSVRTTVPYLYKYRSDLESEPANQGANFSPYIHIGKNCFVPVR